MLRTSDSVSIRSRMGFATGSRKVQASSILLCGAEKPTHWFHNDSFRIPADNTMTLQFQSIVSCANIEILLELR